VGSIRAFTNSANRTVINSTVTSTSQLGGGQLFKAEASAQALPLGLVVATAFGAVLGLAIGYSPRHEWFNTLLALIGAVVFGGWVYWLRAFR
jgi:hypothetical protein